MTFEIAAGRTPEPGRDARPVWLDWVAAQGEMGARVAAHDWAATPLGPIEQWPSAAQAAVVLCVGSLFPMTLRLGDELRLIYNDACREVYGPERFETALGRSSDEVWPETEGQTAGLVRDVMATGTPFFDTDHLLYLRRTVPREECFFTFCFSAIVEDDATLSGVLATFVETTSKVVSERRLRTLERLGRELVPGRSESELAELAAQTLAANDSDHPGVALYRVRDDRPVALAAAGEPLTGDHVDALVRACFSTGAAQHGADDDPATERLHAYPVVDPERRVSTHVLLVRHHPSRPWDADLGAYLELAAASLGSSLLTQAELLAERRRVARATALDAAKSAFFAGVSHELTTPLALISAPLEDILERETDLPARVRQPLVLARASVSRLARMVEAILDFSRMEAGRLVPNLQPTDLSVLTRGLCAAFVPAVQRAGLEFVVEAPDLSRPVMIDRDFYERIVLNLLSNAVKFTSVGTVGLRLAEDGDSYRVEVFDTGPGIEPDDQDRVFARFERLRTPAGGRAAPGAGIGLAMVRQLTELLGGQVELDSTPGSGSRFAVVLPFTPPSSGSGAGQSITPRRVDSFLAEFDTWPAAAAARREGGGPRLLVVEDDAHLARFLADSLSEGYVVDTAGDGEAALAAMRAQRPDVVLTDLAMPGTDGLELVRQVRADPDLRDLPVLVLSARSGTREAAIGFDVGADDYISKPFTMADLRARIAANLERARERSMDAAWRRAVLTAITDALVIFDSEGLVLEVNQAFTDLLGYTIDDGPFRPPYPWWPTEAEDAESLAEIRRVHERALRGEPGTAEVRFFRRDRTPLWVRTSDARVQHGAAGLTANVRTVRDVTRDHEARDRRAAAAQVSADLATVEDLDTLLAIAEHGLATLFNGGSTVQVRLDKSRHLLVAGGVTVTPEDLPEQVRTGLGGEPNPDTASLRPGILLVPRSGSTDCRAWVQFPQPRRIGADEMIVADLLAQAFAIAVDRVIAAQRAADREANLQQAMESHRLIGQAIGILVERHRLLPSQAFERLRATSQNRNLKLREVARRVIETGAEPDEV